MATGMNCAFGGGTSTIRAFKDLTILDPTTTHISSFDETFAVPEPMTLSLLGAGLLGLGLLRRRMKK